MALGITTRNLIPRAGGLFKGRKVKLVTFTGDASMPAGGYIVAAADVGMRIIESGICGHDRKGTYSFTLIPSNTASSALTLSSNRATLLPFDSANASVTASVAAVSSATVDAIIFGY